MTPLQYLGAYLFTVIILWAAIKMSPEAKAEEEVLARYPALQKAIDVILYIYLAPLFLVHLVRQKIRPKRLVKPNEDGRRSDKVTPDAHLIKPTE